jgi:aspartate-semialdehyde dehydrogenase
MKAPGITLIDQYTDGGYLTRADGRSDDGADDHVGEHAVFVRRLREDISHPAALNLWTVSDNVRKGASLNSIQIAEFLLKSYF